MENIRTGDRLISDKQRCLFAERDAYNHLFRAAENLAEVYDVEEGRHYLVEAGKYISKAMDMLNRYRGFINEK